MSGSGFQRLQVFRGAGKGAGTRECWSGVSDLRTWGHEFRCGVRLVCTCHGALVGSVLGVFC